MKPNRISSLRALLCCALAGACVDSSLPPKGSGFEPPTEPATIDVLPPEWTTVPGKSLTFQATDPLSNAALVWSVPSELYELSVESHAITLGSGKPKGTFVLQVRSSFDPAVVGTATIRVVPFGYGGTLGSLPADASGEPLAGVAVTRGKGPPAERRVFVALYDPATESNLVSVWDHAFATELDRATGQHFNTVQRPRLAADAHGRAYWIEQFFDPIANARSRGILRRNSDGTLDRFEWTPAATGGLELVPGTDVACDDGGALYFMARNGLANVIVRCDDIFLPGAEPAIVGPLAAAGPEVQLAVDAAGNLLVAVDTLLARWTPAPQGGVDVQVLADLGAVPADLGADADGTLYVMFETRIDVLDSAGHLVGSLASAEVGQPDKVPFVQLLGLGPDGDGNLRLIDDPLVDGARLGAPVLRTFALDVQQP